MEKRYSAVLVGLTWAMFACGGDSIVQPSPGVDSVEPASGDVSGEVSVPAGHEDGPWVAKVYFTGIDELTALTSRHAPWEVDHEWGYVVIEIAGPAERAKLEADGYTVYIDEGLTALAHAPPRSLETLAGIPGYACYRTVEETYQSAEQIVADHPNLATWTDIGDSWEKIQDSSNGYDIRVLRLTNQSTPGPKPVFFAMSAIHAREYTTAELNTRFAEYLVDNYGSDADATWLLDHHEVHLVLQSNPDGRKKAEAGQLWRKNVNERYCGSTSSSRGADLNRNYPYAWGGSGSSGDPCDSTYRGPWPGSEPETQAITDYVVSIFPDQRGIPRDLPAPDDATGIFMDIHSYSELVLWPWGDTSTDAPNGTQLQTLGRKFAYFNDYEPQQSIELYPTNGTTEDWAYGVLGVASFTFELGTSFFQNCSTFENTILPDNLQALIYAAKTSRTPYITPSGPDSLNVTLAASSVVQGDDAELSATANDTRYNNSNGTEPTDTVDAAAAYIDTPPWDTDAVAIPLSAQDGVFNEGVEPIEGSIDTSALSVGSHIIYVRAQDSQGNWGAVSAVFLEVLPGSGNTAPTVTITSPGDGSSVDEGTPVSLSASASDAEDGDLTASIAWTSSLDGAIATGGSASVTLSPGSHVLTASATDSNDVTGNDTVVVTVVSNTAPSVTISSPANGASFEAGTPVSLSATASDAEDGNLTPSITWTSNLDGAIASGGSASVTLSLGSHVLTASVTDSGSLSGSDSVTVSVVSNTPPSVSISAPSNGSSFEAGTPVSLSASAADAEDGNLTSSITWTSSRDGAIASGGSASVTLSVGSHVLTASVTDSGSLTSSDSVSVTVVGGNTAPSVAINAPTDGGGYGSGAPVLLSGTATDAEDGDLAGDILWTSSLDGTIATGGSALVSLSIGTHVITASVSDSGGLGSSDSVTITVTSAVVLAHDDFESGLGTYVDGGSDANRVLSLFSHQGLFSMEIRDNTGVPSSFYTTGGQFSVAGFSEFEVSFWYRSNSMETDESFFIDLSIDGGASWGKWAWFSSGRDFTNGPYYNPSMVLDLAALGSPSTIDIRFRSAASDDSDTVYIDEITVMAR